MVISPQARDRALGCAELHSPQHRAANVRERPMPESRGRARWPLFDIRCSVLAVTPRTEAAESASSERSLTESADSGSDARSYLAVLPESR